jgi:HPt (histidine-containing phosphotransfer) domain-containing protein
MVSGGSGQGPAAPLIDPDAIERLRQLDPTGQQGVLLRVLQAYETTLTRHLADVADAWAQAEADRLARAAHSLKSSSAAVGAMGFAQICADLEQMVRERKGLPDGALVEALIHEGRRVLRAVGDMLQNQSGASA